MSIDPEAFFGASARWGVGMASRPGSQSSSHPSSLDHENVWLWCTRPTGTNPLGPVEPGTSQPGRQSQLSC